MAEVSHFSVYHFHRIFTGIVGETINDYIARRRLEKAINQLVFNAKSSTTEVAFNNGLSSSANFSKAVKLHFGFSPSEIRNPGKIKNGKIGKISSKYGKDFNRKRLTNHRLASHFGETLEERVSRVLPWFRVIPAGAGALLTS